MTPTAAEIQRVRKWECKMRGHHFQQIMVNDSDIPIALVCDNCGLRANVVPTDG